MSLSVYRKLLLGGGATNKYLSSIGGSFSHLPMRDSGGYSSEGR